jgi:hypothetical protein
VSAATLIGFKQGKPGELTQDFLDEPDDDFRKREPSADYDKPRRYTAPDGEIAILPSMKQADETSAKVTEIHERQIRARAAREAKDLADFEERVKRELDEARGRAGAGDVIDGRRK